jgi:hypothetical protein
MQKTITLIFTIGALLIILDTMNAANSFILFLFAGVVPGTEFRIAAIDMMAATATAITVIVARLTLWPKIRSSMFIAPPVPRAKRVSRRTA